MRGGRAAGGLLAVVGGVVRRAARAPAAAPPPGAWQRRARRPSCRRAIWRQRWQRSERHPFRAYHRHAPWPCVILCADSRFPKSPLQRSANPPPTARPLPAHYRRCARPDAAASLLVLAPCTTALDRHHSPPRLQHQLHLPPRPQIPRAPNRPTPRPSPGIHPPRACCRCPKQGQGPLLFSLLALASDSTKICVLHVTAPAPGSLHAFPAALLR